MASQITLLHHLNVSELNFREVLSNRITRQARKEVNGTERNALEETKNIFTK